MKYTKAKRILAMLLVFTMCATLMPLSVFAENVDSSDNLPVVEEPAGPSSTPAEGESVQKNEDAADTSANEGEQKTEAAPDGENDSDTANTAAPLNNDEKEDSNTDNETCSVKEEKDEKKQDDSVVNPENTPELLGADGEKEVSPAATVQNAINALPAPGTTEEYMAMEDDTIAALEQQTADAASGYNALTDEEKATITDADKIEALQNWLDAMKVQKQIDALPTTDELDAMTPEQKEAAYQELQEVKAAKDALSDEEKALINASAIDTVEQWFKTQGQIGELLVGDYAKLKAFNFAANASTESSYAISTGTAPWDANDNAGNDSSNLNNVVRTYDSVTYTLNMETSMQADAAERGFTAFKEGTVYFEYILPVDSSKAMFDTDAMGWLESSQEVVYEIANVTIDGAACQVLRGSYLAVPSTDNPAAIGASMSSLNVAVRVLAMHNGDTIQPKFTMWLKDNEVGTTYSGDNGGIPQSIVTGSGAVCGTHGGQEYITVVAPKVTVSAAPRYNVGIRCVEDRTNAIGYFDFSTGNDLAQNKDMGTLYGRMMSYALYLKIDGKSNQGLRGIELPDESTDITFDLKLSSSYIPDGTTTPVANDGYQPVFWSGEGHNSAPTGQDGRHCGPATSMLNTFPYNKQGETGAAYPECSCYNGGKWIFVVDENDRSIVHVTVSGYQVDLSKMPRTHAGWGKAAGHYELYNTPAFGDNYWLASTSWVGVGEMRVLMPFNSTKDGTYISDTLGAGTNKITVADSNFKMTGVSGTVIDSTTQTVKNDDTATTSVLLAKPGTVSVSIYWTKTSSSPLTEGCLYNGKDWAFEGQNASIWAQMTVSNAEEMNIAAARDILIKFDDAGFEITGASKNETGKKTFYGAKPDGSGWNHNGLQPGDDGYDKEMIYTSVDDLVWYPSLAELKAAGATCVAVLRETRTLNTSSTDNAAINYVYGKFKNETSGNVYMAVGEWIMWRKRDVTAGAAEHFNVSADALTSEQYLDYVRNVFPSRSDPNIKSYADYPAPSIARTPDPDLATSQAMLDVYSSIKKAVYVDGVYQEKDSDYQNFGAQDSAYIVPLVTKITKNIAQTNSDGTDKKVYDMGQNQRIVDFVIAPKLERGATSSSTLTALTTTTVTIKDTLSAGLTYINGSSKWDRDGTASYTQGRRQQSQGTVTGAVDLEPEVTANADGTTTLVWTLENISVDKLQSDTTQLLGNIWYSCEIGTPGNEETDVQNQDQLSNTVTISSTEDHRVKDSRNGNLATAGLEILKQNAVSLSKTADQPIVDVNEDIGFTINIGNNSDQPIMNAVIIDALPYNGDGRGTSFNGELYLTDVVSKGTEDTLYRNLRYFYTTNEDYRGETSEYFLAEGYSAVTFAAADDWTELTLGTDLTEQMFTNLPAVTSQTGSNQIVAIAIVGDIPSLKTIKIHLNMRISDPKAADQIVNQLSSGTLESYARTTIGERRLSGLAWFDENRDGLRQTSETLLPGTKVTLLKLNEEGEYEVVKYTSSTMRAGEQDATITTGQQLNLLTGEVSDITGHTTASYMFTMLPAGTFAVRFEDSDGSWTTKTYSATLVNAGDDTKDSDAEGTYNGTVLTKTQISGIVMPLSKDLRTSIYESKNNDSGYSNTELTVTKVWEDDEDRDGKRPNDVKVQLYASGSAYGEAVTLNEGNEWTYTWSPLPLVKDGETIEYTVAETTLTSDYESDATTEAPAAFEDGEATVTNTHEPEKTEIKVRKVWNDEDLLPVDGYSRPESVEFTLKGTISGKTEPVYEKSVTLNEDNSWSATFEDLYVYEEGTKITYAVTEKIPAGYTATNAEQDADGVYFIKNTPDTGEKITPVTMSFLKTDSNTDAPLSGAVFTITKNGETAGVTEKTDAEGKTSFTFTNEGSYTITETTAPEGYQKSATTYTVVVEKSGIISVTLNEEKNIWEKLYNLFFGEKQEDCFKDGVLTVPNDPILIDIPVEKVWDDDDNRDDLRDEYGVTLYADGVAVGDEVILDKDELSYTWEKLPLYKSGKKITYTVEETTVPEGYDGVVTGDPDNGFIATNTHEPETITIEGKKTWVDYNNKYNLRPRSIVIHLLANGKEVAKVTVTAADGWKWTFTDVPKNEDGKEIKYTISEDAVSNYIAQVKGYDVTNSYKDMPPTGDNSKPMLWIGLMVLAVVLAGGVTFGVVSGKKRNANKTQ